MAMSTPSTLKLSVSPSEPARIADTRSGVISVRRCVALSTQNGGIDVSVDSNKDVVRRVFAEVVSGGDIDLIEKIAHEDMTDHLAMAVGWGAGRKGFQTHIETVRAMIDNFNAEVTETVGEGDVVVAFWTGTGTVLNDSLGYPVTGRPFTAPAISRLRFEDGLITEYSVMVGPLADA
jgi:ketosteroid isomerase-like protein